MMVMPGKGGKGCVADGADRLVGARLVVLAALTETARSAAATLRPRLELFAAKLMLMDTTVAAFKSPSVAFVAASRIARCRVVERATPDR